MSYTLPDLPYAYDALEPHFDKETMELHHSKHHQTYLNNAHGLLEGTGLMEKYSPEELLLNIEEVPEDIRQGVVNNVGGHVNHSFFWSILSPEGERKPVGKLAEAIEAQFGDFCEFGKQFEAKAKAVFGAGWVWLCRDVDGNLVLKRTSFQDSPLLQGLVPLIGLDVWEHAYYLKYQNRRPEYIEAFWNVLDWSKVEEIFVK